MITKEEMRLQINVRKEEFEEMEELVKKFAENNKHAPFMIKAHTISAFRAGLIEMLHWMDQKAQAKKIERSLKQEMVDPG